MTARLATDPRLLDLRMAVADAAQMLDEALLYTGEEVLGRLLGATRLAFDIVGSGDEETGRRALHQALVAYVDVPAPIGGNIAALDAQRQRGAA